MSNLLNLSFSEDLLMKAKVARELGMFDEAQNLLDPSPISRNRQKTVEKIRPLCDQGKTLVAEVEYGEENDVIHIMM